MEVKLTPNFRHSQTDLVVCTNFVCVWRKFNMMFYMKCSFKITFFCTTHYVHFWYACLMHCMDTRKLTYTYSGVHDMNIGKTVRKAVQRLADAIDGIEDRMSHDDIIDACAVSTPSVIGTLIFCLFDTCPCVMACY